MVFNFNLPNDTDVVSFLKEYDPSTSFSKLSGYNAIAALGTVERRAYYEKIHLDTKIKEKELYMEKVLYLRVQTGKKPTVNEVESEVLKDPNMQTLLREEQEANMEYEKYKAISNVLISVLKSSAMLGNE